MPVSAGSGGVAYQNFVGVDGNNLLPSDEEQDMRDAALVCQLERCLNCREAGGVDVASYRWLDEQLKTRAGRATISRVFIGSLTGNPESLAARFSHTKPEGILALFENCPAILESCSLSDLVFFAKKSKDLAVFVLQNPAAYKILKDSPDAVKTICDAHPEDWIVLHLARPILKPEALLQAWQLLQLQQKELTHYLSAFGLERNWENACDFMRQGGKPNDENCFALLASAHTREKFTEVLAYISKHHPGFFDVASSVALSDESLRVELFHLSRLPAEMQARTQGEIKSIFGLVGPAFEGFMEFFEEENLLKLISSPFAGKTLGEMYGRGVGIVDLALENFKKFFVEKDFLELISSRFAGEALKKMCGKPIGLVASASSKLGSRLDQGFCDESYKGEGYKESPEALSKLFGRMLAVVAPSATAAFVEMHGPWMVGPRPENWSCFAGVDFPAHVVSAFSVEVVKLLYQDRPEAFAKLCESMKSADIISFISRNCHWMGNEHWFHLLFVLRNKNKRLLRQLFSVPGRAEKLSHHIAEIIRLSSADKFANDSYRVITLLEEYPELLGPVMSRVTAAQLSTWLEGLRAVSKGNYRCACAVFAPCLLSTEVRGASLLFGKHSKLKAQSELLRKLAGPRFRSQKKIRVAVVKEFLKIFKDGGFRCDEAFLEGKHERRIIGALLANPNSSLPEIKSQVYRGCGASLWDTMLLTLFGIRTNHLKVVEAFARAEFARIREFFFSERSALLQARVPREDPVKAAAPSDEPLPVFTQELAATSSALGDQSPAIPKASQSPAALKGERCVSGKLSSSSSSLASSTSSSDLGYGSDSQSARPKKHEVEGFPKRSSNSFRHGLCYSLWAPSAFASRTVAPVEPLAECFDFQQNPDAQSPDVRSRLRVF